jgi:hypothetical protein
LLFALVLDLGFWLGLWLRCRLGLAHINQLLIGDFYPYLVFQFDMNCLFDGAHLDHFAPPLWRVDHFPRFGSLFLTLT